MAATTRHIFNDYIRTIFNLVKAETELAFFLAGKGKKVKFFKIVMMKNIFQFHERARCASFEVVVVRPFSRYFLSSDA